MLRGRYWWLPFLLTLAVCQAEPRVEALVGSRQVALKETFIYQLKIISDKDELIRAPTFPDTPDFRVMGPGQPNTSTSNSISIVNGKTTSTKTVEYTYTYSLTPQREGTLQIPSVSVQVGKKVLRSQPVTIKVSKEANLQGDMSLVAMASAKSCYVGEAVMLDWEWFVDQKVYEYIFNLPVLSLDAFTFPNFIPDYISNQGQVMGGQAMELANSQNKQIFARQRAVNKGGIRGTSITFSQPLIANRAGKFILPPASVQLQVEDTRGRRQPQRRSPFDDFDDFFSRSRRSYRLLTLESQPLSLEVKELPEEGKPANFSGIVGTCAVTVKAEPLEVTVGEPILLNIAVTGPQFLDTVKLPDFSRQENLAGQFKVSGDEPGLVSNGEKVFQRTLRATSADCKEIPPLEIPYFNSATGKYEVAKSQAIPLKVTAVRNLTLSDAQGAPATTDDMASGREVRQALTGLVHNYAPEELLESQTTPDAWWRLLSVRLVLLLPPGLWLLLGVAKWLHNRLYGDPLAVSARQAVPNCLRKLKRLRGEAGATPEQLSQVLQEFFADLYGLQAGTITYADLQEISSKRGEKTDRWQDFQEIFAACEEARFAGGGQAVSLGELIDKMQNALKHIG